jgi:hypothetical protein
VFDLIGSHTAGGQLRALGIPAATVAAVGPLITALPPFDASPPENPGVPRVRLSARLRHLVQRTGPWLRYGYLATADAYYRYRSRQ